MRITIFYDSEGKCRQVINCIGEQTPKGRTQVGCSALDIVETITRSNRDAGNKGYHHFTVD